MRDAKNGEEIIEKVKKEAGIDIEIISGDEEARLIFGAFQLLKIEKKSHYLVIDVGGGSTEITIFENGIKIAARSFDIGTVRILKDKVTDSSWENVKTWLAENVSNNPHNVYGTGGNINKIHKLFGLTDDEEVSLSEMVDFADKLKVLSLEDRMKKYKLKADRADVILPALDIYIFCLNCLNVNEIAVPKMGLSDGMIYDMYLKSF
jgi:exopolyphosphatase/guanosine-5'-triphosphate,3'-diphosphate pyrophosphatase